jgi:hypothetical protein
MNVIVPMSVIMVLRLTVRMPVMFMHVHCSAFYVLRALRAAVVGWLTTPSRDFVDASDSRCHYQKRCIRTSLKRCFTG